MAPSPMTLLEGGPGSLGISAWNFSVLLYNELRASPDRKAALFDNATPMKKVVTTACVGPGASSC